MTTSNEHNNAPAVPQGEPVAWLDLSKLSASAMVYATGWKSNDKQSPLYTTPAPAPARGEPFGYFRAEPFGWTDCSEDAEGAIALYEHPAAPAQEAELTDDERQQVFRNAENRMVSEINLSWRNAVVDEVISALRAKGQV